MKVLPRIFGSILAVGASALLTVHGRAADAKSKVAIPIRTIDLKEAAKVSFSRDIRPILANDCDECHSAEDHKSNFDVTSVATLLKRGKKAGAGVVPGKPDESSIVQYIRGLADGPQMPKNEAVLSEQDLHLIRSWIAAGAVDDSAAFAATSAAVKKKSVSAAAPADVTQALADAFIFGTDKNEQFAARRAYRLSLVPPAPKPPPVDSPAFNEIDQFIAAKWVSAKLPEAASAPPLCDDATFFRRIYLDLIGVIPSASASRKFVADEDPAKRAKAVDALLARKEEYASHWTPFWEDALASTPSVGGIATHGNYTEFIYNSFLENKPYDLMVAELLDPTMPGHKKSSTANANGKINVIGFVRNDDHKDTIQTAANTAQIFLATGMKCASCHSHFLNKEWPQKRFTAFAGLFGTNDLELIRCEKHSGQFVPAAFPFDLPDASAVVPHDIDGRLHYLTTLLIDPANPRFAKAIVNRLWKRYLGLGLFEPVDDFRLDRNASHPELLNWLADDFMRHNYDLKHTVRLILTSRTYQLRYDPAVEDHFNVQKPDEPRFARSPSLRRLTAEQFVDSIHKAAAKSWDGHRLYRTTASTALTRALGRPAARNEISTGRSDDVAVVQSLEVLNGDELHQFVYSGEILDELASQSDRKKIIDQLYWTVLNRPPSAEEIKLGLAYLKDNLPAAAPGKVEPAGETVWIDDDFPPGGQPNGDAWKWVEAPAAPVFSGKRAHTFNGSSEKQHQHYFTGASPLKIAADDQFFTYVYIDSAKPPKEIMLQWFQNNWEHRAFWGQDKIAYGAGGEPSRRAMGELPATGKWVRLEVPASRVGIDSNTEITGWSFDQVGGKVYWDKSGVIRQTRSPETEPLGDMLWALVVSPEFQFIR